MTGLTIEGAKAQARALRVALRAEGTEIGHAQALERVARQQGARDWNTLRARLGREGAREAAPEPVLVPGGRVSGRYLGHAYTGRIVSLSGPVGERRIEIALDTPVDTVRFESFSNWRRRVRGTLGPDGRSHDKTSDGMPHLTVAPAPG